MGSDQSPIDLFKGSGKANRVEAIAISADILKKDCEVKLLVGCTEQETEKILQFLNQTQFQKADPCAQRERDAIMGDQRLRSWSFLLYRETERHKIKRNGGNQICLLST